jgi:hypothetical protein
VRSHPFAGGSRYQDCFPDGYYFFSWKVADSVVGATALNGLVGNILHIFFMPLVRPDFWRDRFGALTDSHTSHR